MEGTGSGGCFQRPHKGCWVVGAGWQVHREVGAVKPLVWQGSFNDVAVQELVQVVPVLVSRNERDTKGPVAGLLHHRGHYVVAVDGHHVAVADSVGEEGQTGHLEPFLAELSGPQLLAPAVL